MGTKEVRITLTEDTHEKLSEQKSDHTWRDAVIVGCQELDAGAEVDE